MPKIKIAIQTRSDGVITGYQVYTGDTVPQGFDAIVELEDGIIVGGPEIVQAYRYRDGAIVKRTAKERRRDSHTFRMKAAQTDHIYYPSAERFAKDVVRELSAGARRTREIVLIVFSLALALGVASSALVTYIASPTPIVLLVMLVAVTASIALAVFYLTREYGQKIALFRVPTAIVYIASKGEVALPRVIPLGRRMSAVSRPMILSSRKLIAALGKFNLLSQHPFQKSQIAVFLLILAKMNEMNQFGAGRAIGPSIDIGPFAGAGMYKSLPFQVVPIEEACPSEKDLFLIQEAMPQLKSILLPLGLTLEITFLDPNKACKIAFVNRDLSLTVSVSMGTGNRLDYSQWARSFNMPANQLYADGVVLDGLLKYGGLWKRILSTLLRRGKWSLFDYLTWASDTMQWITEYVSWLENDTDIPQERAFILVQDNPITYQAAVPSANPLLSRVIFDE